MSRIRNVEIEDLLSREPVSLDTEAIANNLHDNVVLITGAGGSIGSELCRQICLFKPNRIVLVEQAENNLFFIHNQLKENYPDVDIVPCIADICDKHRIEYIFELYQPKFVFHSAAHKHVPMMEWNPGEAIKNNVIGSKIVADVANDKNVDRFVMISTDKAVNPTSVMGATKRLAEVYIKSLSEKSNTIFCAVRFGNVLNSIGSVIPTFKKQIVGGGPVTVTHPDMKRYFMTISEASQLVLQAAVLSNGGEIFVLDMGEPVYIKDLAEELIRLSGFEPYKDIDIIFTGIRPGEKLFEELSLNEENIIKTEHQKIFVYDIKPKPRSYVTKRIQQMDEIAETNERLKIIKKLSEILPEYKPPIQND